MPLGPQRRGPAKTTQNVPAVLLVVGVGVPGCVITQSQENIIRSKSIRNSRDVNMKNAASKSLRKMVQKMSWRNAMAKVVHLMIYIFEKCLGDAEAVEKVGVEDGTNPKCASK